MSNDPTGRLGKGKPRAPGADPGSAGRRQGAKYEVGYGKPPKHTRFVKGQSGNPRGRPRKPKPRSPRLSDAPSDRFLEEEAYRSVALRENGQAIELPATQAVMRALTTGAIKGNRLSQKYFLQHVARMEELHFQRKLEQYRRLETLKRKGEQALADHERRGLPHPDLLPHPDDIVLNPATGEAYVNGPVTPEDVHFYEHSVQLRDHALLRSAHAYEGRRKSATDSEGGTVCGYLVCAQLLDQILPRRYRWQNNAEFYLLSEYQDLPRRERERRMAAEFVRLDATKPRPSLVTPEMEQDIDRISRKFFKKREQRP